MAIVVAIVTKYRQRFIATIFWAVSAVFFQCVALCVGIVNYFYLCGFTVATELPKLIQHHPTMNLTHL